MAVKPPRPPTLGRTVSESSQCIPKEQKGGLGKLRRLQVHSAGRQRSKVCVRGSAGSQVRAQPGWEASVAPHPLLAPIPGNTSTRLGALIKVLFFNYMLIVTNPTTLKQIKWAGKGFPPPSLSPSSQLRLCPVWLEKQAQSPAFPHPILWFTGATTWELLFHLLGPQFPRLQNGV